MKVNRDYNGAQTTQPPQETTFQRINAAWQSVMQQKKEGSGSTSKQFCAHYEDERGRRLCEGIIQGLMNILTTGS